MALLTEKNSVCITVLSMRSGTSAMARVLNILGVDIGSNLCGPRDDNPRGFWEHADINRLDDQMLEILGSSWDDYGVLPRGWQEKSEVAQIQDEIISFLSRDFSNSGLWMVKEPRLTRLIPAWEPIWMTMYASPCFVLMLRHPLEIAASLQKKYGFDLTKSLRLITRYLLDAERYTRGQRRTVVAYEELLSDWRAVAHNISSALNVKFPVSFEEAEKEVGAFLTGDLKHHKSIDSDWSKIDVDKDTIKAAKTAYELISTIPYKDITEEINSTALGFENIVERFPMRSQFSVYWRGFLARTIRKHPMARSVLVRLRDV